MKTSKSSEQPWYTGTKTESVKWNTTTTRRPTTNIDIQQYTGTNGVPHRQVSRAVREITGVSQLTAKAKPDPGNSTALQTQATFGEAVLLT